jgi:CRISPR-associated protein Csb2
MSYLCFTIRLLQPCYHGRCDGAEPEWPPSPLRLFQALVAAASSRWCNEEFDIDVAPALRWLEQQRLPLIVAVNGRQAASKYRLYVPDNSGDLAAGTWSRGDTTKIIRRTEKDVRPIHLPDFGEAHFLYPSTNGACPYLEVLRTAAHSITHLGWGVDMVSGNVTNVSEQESTELKGDVWRPVSSTNARELRVPINGTLNALIAKHQAFLSRISRDALGNDTFNPVPPLKIFHVVGYRRASDPISQPAIVFELRNDDDSLFRYSQEKFVHLAGMVRHVAIETMTKSRPEGVAEDWVETCVAGHARPNAADHWQFSYLPLPSIGHAHVDQAVRRVMVAAPVGGDRLLNHLARMLAGRQLKPTDRTKLDHPPTLVRVPNDKVARSYTRPANAWASVTPVILPGHDDHKPAKTRKLIEKALFQCGIEQPCEFEFGPFSRFPKSLSAHKYGRDKKPTGYIRPDHLLNQTAVHLTLRFKEKVPGPLVIGAGRHCGFGLMACVDS